MQLEHSYFHQLKQGSQTYWYEWPYWVLSSHLGHLVSSLALHHMVYLALFFLSNFSVFAENKGSCNDTLLHNDVQEHLAESASPKSIWYNEFDAYSQHYCDVLSVSDSNWQIQVFLNPLLFHFPDFVVFLHT